MRKDIDLNFSTHPITGDLAIKKDSNAIKQSLKNIALTNFYERGFNIPVGTDVKGSLFEIISSLDMQVLAEKIKTSIINFESQVEVITVDVINSNNNEITAKIIYTEFNNPEPVEYSVILERTR